MSGENVETKRAFVCLLLKVSGNVNADAGVGTRIPLKKIITMNKEIKAFVSARCIRRAIRKRMYERGLRIDPMFVEREKLFDAADPIKYADDDLFGYLAPGEVISRNGPIKISPLISLRHTEIKVEFAARFPRSDFIPDAQKAYPTPYEVEVAEFIGRLNVIISDQVGKFYEDELIGDVKKKIESKEGDYGNVEKVDNQYILSLDKRRERLRVFLEILLREGWEFPRGSQSPNVPEYYYAVIMLTKRFVPIFGYIDITEDEKLNEALLMKAREQYHGLFDAMIVIDYKNGRVSIISEKEEEKELTADTWSDVIEGIINYIIS